MIYNAFVSHWRESHWRVSQRRNEIVAAFD
jgi:hypothetical protein